jgi:high affinity Mn2+ porin
MSERLATRACHCAMFVKRTITKKIAFACVVVLLIAPHGPARSDDLGTGASPFTPNWTGAYVGGHFGYGIGSFGSGTNPTLAEAVLLRPTVTGLVGGFQAGYNVQLPNKLVLGAEADLSFPSPIDRPATGTAPFNTTIDYFGTARARIGYALGNVLPYLTGGIGWGKSRINVNDTSGNVIASKTAMQAGWTAGLGLEYALTSPGTAKVEYNYIDLGHRTYGLVDGAIQSSLPVDPKVQVLKFGLDYRLPNLSTSFPSESAGPSTSSVSFADNWNLHGQTTFIWQGYGPIRSPYQGENSLPGSGEGRETWTATAFIGWRLWQGGEFYFNPELAQGFGLANTLGLGGFANGEAEKAGSEFPKIRAQRYFFRQTFGLGGEQETVEDAPNQLAGKRDVDRVTLTIGRFAVGDIFDNNTYAHDPRVDFMNWAMWSSAAYDYPADLPGFTLGAVAELNRKNWAVRAGLFQVPSAPDSDVLVFKTGGALVEFEGRYTLFDEPGKIRLGAFLNRGNMGNYQQALALESLDPSANINNVMTSIRSQHLKGGTYLNVEQTLTNDIGVFARASWNDGQNEILSFTDIDRSVSSGISIKGNAWNRPKDTFGLAGAINGLSESHREFLAAGGLGLLIGDGALKYREEKIIEAYYSISLFKAGALTFDYQFVDNPAYNADRGPVSIFAARFHDEF